MDPQVCKHLNCQLDSHAREAFLFVETKRLQRSSKGSLKSFLSETNDQGQPANGHLCAQNGKRWPRSFGRERLKAVQVRLTCFFFVSQPFHFEREKGLQAAEDLFTTSLG